MPPRPQPPFPSVPFALLLVEGGDEQRLCEALLGPTETHARPTCFRRANGRAFEELAALVVKEPHWVHTTHVAIVLDAEEAPAASVDLAKRALRVLGSRAAAAPGQLDGGRPAAGFFVLPSEAAHGAHETLLRQVAADGARARCADAFEACTSVHHSTAANRDKSWVQSYLAASSDGGLRTHDALAQQGWFDLGHTLLDPLRTFLRVLVR